MLYIYSSIYYVCVIISIAVYIMCVYVIYIAVYSMCVYILNLVLMYEINDYFY